MDIIYRSMEEYTQNSLSHLSYTSCQLINGETGVVGVEVFFYRETPPEERPANGSVKFQLINNDLVPDKNDPLLDTIRKSYLGIYLLLKYKALSMLSDRLHQQSNNEIPNEDYRNHSTVSIPIEYLKFRGIEFKNLQYGNDRQSVLGTLCFHYTGVESNGFPDVDFELHSDELLLSDDLWMIALRNQLFGVYELIEFFVKRQAIIDVRRAN